MGAQRWINLGLFQLQPSEVMKIALVLALARYFHGGYLEDVAQPAHLILPVVLVLAPAALVLKQPDLGTAVMLLAGGGALLFLAGVRWWKFALVIGAVLAAAADPLAAAARLPEAAGDDLPRPRARPARRRLPHHPVEDRARLGRALGQGLPQGHPEPAELPAGEADRLRVHDAGRGGRAGRRARPARACSWCWSATASSSRCARAASSAACSRWASRRPSSSTSRSTSRW